MWNLPTRLIKVRSLIMFLSKPCIGSFLRLAFWTFSSFGYQWKVVLRKFRDKFLDVHLGSYEKNVKIHHTGFIMNSRCAILECYASRCPRVVGLLW